MELLFSIMFVVANNLKLLSSVHFKLWKIVTNIQHPAKPNHTTWHTLISKAIDKKWQRNWGKKRTKAVQVFAQL